MCSIKYSFSDISGLFFSSSLKFNNDSLDFWQKSSLLKSSVSAKTLNLVKNKKKVVKKKVKKKKKSFFLIWKNKFLIFK